MAVRRTYDVTGPQHWCLAHRDDEQAAEEKADYEDSTGETTDLALWSLDSCYDEHRGTWWPGESRFNWNEIREESDPGIQVHVFALDPAPEHA